MNRFIISIGSNSVDRHDRVEKAVAYLMAITAVERVSMIYETEPWGGGDKEYCNCVILGSASMDLERLSALAKEWESTNGRDEASRKAGIVPVDVDVVVWNDEVLRPRELEREYFLKGYREIIP